MVVGNIVVVHGSTSIPLKPENPDPSVPLISIARPTPKTLTLAWLKREGKRVGGGRQLTIGGAVCGRAMAMNERSKVKRKVQEGGTELERSTVADDIDGNGQRPDPHFSFERKADGEQRPRRQNQGSGQHRLEI